MAVSIDYVVRETATNLRRNLLMTWRPCSRWPCRSRCVGGALLLKQGVANATVQWRGGVELSIFMDPRRHRPRPTPSSAELKTMPEVKTLSYVGQEAAFEEFKTMFADQPDLVESVTPSDLPPSYRVVPKQPEQAAIIGARFDKHPGVREVVYAEKQVKTLLKVTRVLQIAISRGCRPRLSAALLILNTIRMAIFATAPRGGGDEAGGGHQLVHPGPVHVRGAGAGRLRGPRRLLRGVPGPRVIAGPFPRISSW